ncbi:MAG: CPBP family intramembrane metalloprotease [Planctomycetales bacterium]|nr:CPBP family intramembrane metalloprotease [Planctomycetales bacterium]
MPAEPNHPSQASQWTAVVFALVLPTLVTLAYFVWADSFSPAVQQTTYTIAKAFQFGFPLVWACWRQGQRLQLRPSDMQGVIAGIGFGLLGSLAMMSLYHGWLKHSDLLAGAEGAIRQKLTGMALDQSWKFIALGAFYSLFHSLLEEYYWRWFVFGQLRQMITLGKAVVVSSLGFMAHHVIVLGAYFGYASPETWLFSFSIAIGGAFWAWLYQRSRSLLGPWLGHLLIDAAIFTIGYDIVRDLIGG